MTTLFMTPATRGEQATKRCGSGSSSRFGLLDVVCAVALGRSTRPPAPPLGVREAGDEDEHRADGPSRGAAQVLVLKKVVGMMLWIWGLPARSPW